MFKLFNNTIFGTTFASLVVSSLLLYYSNGLKNYCLDSTKPTAHWPLAYTEYWPPSGGQHPGQSQSSQHATPEPPPPPPAPPTAQQATVQDSFFSPLSTGQFSIVAWMSIASAVLFITFLTSNYLLSTSCGVLLFSCLCCFSAQRLKFFFSFLVVFQVFIAVLLTSAMALSLVSLLVVIPEQTVVGENIYREHFAVVLKHYSFERADRRTRGEPLDKGEQITDHQVVTVRLMAQLQRLQATHQCCGLTRGGHRL